MGRSSFISCSPFSGRAKRQTGFALCLRFKSPKAASNLQFERPWDHFVPAKSVRKLTAATVVSKRFSLCDRRAVVCVVLSAFDSKRARADPLRQDVTASLPSADYVTLLLCFAPH